MVPTMTEKTETLQEYECELCNIIEAIRETDADGEIAGVKDRCIKHLEQGDRTMQRLLSELGKKGKVR